MNSDQNYSSSRIPRPIETAATAIGIALFVVFAFVGVNQAGDRQAVTGNKQDHQSYYSDTEAALPMSGTLMSAVSAKTTNTQDNTSNYDQPLNENKMKNRESASHPNTDSNSKASANKSNRPDHIDKRVKVD